MVLASQPTANVTVTLIPARRPRRRSDDSDLHAGNWNVAQTVTVTAVDDALAEGAHTGTITAHGRQQRPELQRPGVASVTVHITDNDTPGVVVTESSGATDVTEGGANDNYRWCWPPSPRPT